MKTVRSNLFILWILFVVLPFNLPAQVKEIPVTTTSGEALKFFLEGRDKSEDIEIVSAASLFDKAIEKDPEFAMAYLYRSQSGGGASVYRKNLDKAIELADKVSEGEKVLIEFYKSNDEGNLDKQKEYLDKLIALFPSDKRVQLLAGNYYYALYDYPKALAHLSKATELDKNYAMAYNMIGYIQSALEKYPEAEKAFQTYIKLKPGSPNPYDSYGELLLKMGKYDESIVQYKKAFEKDPVNFAGSLAGVGHNYIFKGDYATARKYYQEYYDKAPAIDGKLNALYWKATSFVYEGYVEKAVNTFEDLRMLAEKENIPTQVILSYANMGEILTETGNPAEGMKYYEKAMDLTGKSDLPETTKSRFITYSMMWHAYGLAALGELDKAKSEADVCSQKVASRKNPYEEMMLNSILAYLEIKKADYAKAVQYLSKADKEDPFNWYYNALALSKKGDKQGASKLFEKITKSNVNSLNLALVRKRAMEEMKK